MTYKTIPIMKLKKSKSFSHLFRQMILIGEIEDCFWFSLFDVIFFLTFESSFIKLVIISREILGLCYFKIRGMTLSSWQAYKKACSSWRRKFLIILLSGTNLRQRLTRGVRYFAEPWTQSHAKLLHSSKYFLRFDDKKRFGSFFSTPVTWKYISKFSCCKSVN